LNELEKDLKVLENGDPDAIVDMDEIRRILEEEEAAERAAWEKMSWQERLYDAGSFEWFQPGPVGRESRWIYTKWRAYAWIGYEPVALRIMLTVENQAAADGWTPHRRMMRAAKTRKFGHDDIIAELEYLIEDGCLMVRSNSIEPLYRCRATVKTDASPTDPSPEDSLAIFRSLAGIGPVERRILTAVARQADDDGWATHRGVLRGAMNASTPSAEVIAAIERLIAFGRLEARPSGRTRQYRRCRAQCWEIANGGL
jgi:hypothetical protein